MSSRWDLSEDFEPSVFFTSRAPVAPSDEGPEPADEAQAVARLAGRLRALSARYWDDYCSLAESRRPPEGAEALEVGQILVLTDVPEQQHGGAGGKAKVEPLTWQGHTLALHAGTLHALERALYKAEADWKLRKTGPKQMAVVIEEPARGGIALGADQTGLVARPQVMRTAEGLAAFDVLAEGARVPGTRAAIQRLQVFKDGHREVAVVEPSAIIGPLAKSLAEGDVDLFARLWISGVNAAAHRRRFTQFQRAFNEGGGSLRFDRYDPRQAPEAFEQNKQVRMYVLRKRSDGSEGSSPLILVKEGDDWRLKTGII